MMKMNPIKDSLKHSMLGGMQEKKMEEMSPPLPRATKRSNSKMSKRHGNTRKITRKKEASLQILIQVIMISICHQFQRGKRAVPCQISKCRINYHAGIASSFMISR